MKSEKINLLTQYCIDNLDFSNLGPQERYQSLSVCLLDCVFSLRARYYSTTVPVVERYAAKYMFGNMFSSGDTLCDFLHRIDESGGPEEFAANVLCNRQTLSGRRKADICYEIAEKLFNQLSIDSIDDFQHYEKPELIEPVLRSVKGFGDAGINYLFMLAGDADRCKPDVHIHRCIKDALGEDVSNEECQALLTGVTSMLKANHPALTVRDLDYLIWEKYQIGRRNS